MSAGGQTQSLAAAYNAMQQAHYTVGEKGQLNITKPLPAVSSIVVQLVLHEGNGYNIWEYMYYVLCALITTELRFSRKLGLLLNMNFFSNRVFENRN